MHVIVHGLKEEVEAAPLSILHFILDISTRTLSGDKYLRTHVFWADSSLTLHHAEIGVSCGHRSDCLTDPCTAYLLTLSPTDTTVNQQDQLLICIRYSHWSSICCVLLALLGSHDIRPLHHHGKLSSQDG